MTYIPLRKEPPEGPVTHALVLGIGHYPHKPELNMASAADSAKYMVDWLLNNAENIIPPLGSIDVLISDPPDTDHRYPWAHSGNVENVTAEHLKNAGTRWNDLFAEGSQNSAFFYACGHGAMMGTDPAVLIEDLNQDQFEPWIHLQVGSLARSIKHNKNVESAFLFVDACAEKVPAFALADEDEKPAVVCYPPSQFGVTARANTIVISAAPDGGLAYEAELPRNDEEPEFNGVKIGCFTQALVNALKGNSVRERDNKWAVSSSGLQHDLKPLFRFFFTALDEQPFEPSVLYGFNEERWLVRPENPQIPVVVQTNPLEEFDRFYLSVNHEEPRTSDAMVDGDTMAKCWRPVLPPGFDPVYFVAFDGDNEHWELFRPTRPKFDLKVPVG